MYISRVNYIQISADIHLIRIAQVCQTQYETSCVTKYKFTLHSTKYKVHHSCSGMPDPVWNLLCNKVQGHPCRWKCRRVQQGEIQTWIPIPWQLFCWDIWKWKTRLLIFYFAFSLFILKVSNLGVQEVLRVRQVWLWDRKGSESIHQIPIHQNTLR